VFFKRNENLKFSPFQINRYFQHKSFINAEMILFIE
jgi:hypothetical protein